MMHDLKILDIDPRLTPYKKDLSQRKIHFFETKKRLLRKQDRSLVDFANGYKYFGFSEDKKGWYFREWAPNAEKMELIGDFNNWDYLLGKMENIGEGNWELKRLGQELPVKSKVKVRLRTKQGEILYRVPSFIRRAVQNKQDYTYDGEVWKSTHKWKNKKPQLSCAPLIYEAHIGISTEEHRINTFAEFTRDVLPKISRDGYNALQLMAIMEHPLYSSFGYQVSNFFAVSSRFGTPDDLKQLIDTAHSMGIIVLLDVVHSHAVKNTGDGLNLFDGSDYQYFHEGERGEHPVWNTKLFDYGKPQVLHFLLSNLKYWLDEYCFDGFRFDGVTSMIYKHHGLGVAFSDYGKYFSAVTDVEAIIYLQLANELTHEFAPNSLTIAEDMSAMPGMALAVSSGGIGFDYRLSMRVPDYWIKIIKEKRDEDWDLQQLWYELTLRRPQEKNIGYSESHDQALVGDKTIMFRLANAQIYDKMDIFSESSIIDRAMALHKLIRLITFSLAGEGYLNFMGNEFGHPEWLDFPRLENQNSFQHARRQWSFADADNLRFQYLLKFDNAMINLEKNFKFISSIHSPVQKWVKDADKLLAYERGKLLFVFNFHPTQEKILELWYEKEPKYLMDSDERHFGGFGPRNNFSYNTKEHILRMKLAARTTLVFEIN